MFFVYGSVFGLTDLGIEYFGLRPWFTVKGLQLQMILQGLLLRGLRSGVGV